MTAEILSVGTELLLGDIVDTNAQFLSSELSMLGIDVYFKTSVGDNPVRLMQALTLALSRADIVITTGGLGPTMDDITRECVAQCFGLAMTRDACAASRIVARYEKTGASMPPHALKQADVPCGATVFENECGTAPGCAVEKDGKTIIVLPGPPHEMRAMFTGSVRPYLRARGAGTIYSRVLRIFGLGEPVLEEKIRDMLLAQTNPTIGIYVGFAEARIRISAKATDETQAKALIEPVASQLYARLGRHIYGEGDTSLEEATAQLLMQSGRTLALAESCTGGMIASSLVAFAGISQCLMEGHVTYSNAAKMRVLGVQAQTLARYGAVSSQTAEEMAQGLRARAGTDYALSVTGIAGPDGGTSDKPVGLVYIGFCDACGVTSRRYVFDGERARVRRLSTLHALETLRRALIQAED